jgi:bla regulator protein BlaR1
MKQSEHEISNVIKSALHKSTPSISFETLWDMLANNGKTKSRYRRAALIPLITVFMLLACFTIGYAGLSRMTDNTDLPFADDLSVIGKWETVDFVAEIGDFDPDSRSFQDEDYLNNLVFIKDGRMLDRYENTNLSYSGSTWTKGVIINKAEKTASKYEIKEINGSKYMFMEWKSGDYIFRFMKPEYYVLKQVDAEDYSNYEVPRIEDKIDYAFTNNPDMLGNWESIDRVKNIDDFNPAKLNSEDTLFIKNINILANGKLTIQLMDNQIANSNFSWTEDLIISKDAATASKCTIRTIEGVTYMFYEWKSGDYSYRGMKPEYYVLKKTE